jgi:capsular exopolysaccharide synthesis family protein
MTCHRDCPWCRFLREDRMEIRELVQILDRRRWVIILTTLVAVATAAVGSVLIEPAYTATATVRVSPLVSVGGTVDYGEVEYAERLLETYAALARSESMSAAVQGALGLQTPPRVEAQIVPGTELFRITVEDDNSVRAQWLPNTVASLLVTQDWEESLLEVTSAEDILRAQLVRIESEIEELQAQYDEFGPAFPADPERKAMLNRIISQKVEAYNRLRAQYEQAQISSAMRTELVSIFELATEPKLPSSPRTQLNVALGGVVGLLGGIALALLFEALDSRLYSTERVRSSVDAPILGHIPTLKQLRSGRNSPPKLLSDEKHRAVYRHLSSNVLLLDRNAPIHVLAVTSAEVGEGKSTIVANLAQELAWSGQRVAVVDANMQDPVQHVIFGVTNEVGLSSVLTGTSVQEALQGSRVAGVQVLPGGPMVARPTQILTTAAVCDLMSQLYRGGFNFVLVDTPPIGSVDNISILKAQCTETVLVVRLSKTHQGALEAAMGHLKDLEVHPIGVIVNQARTGMGY